MTPSIVLPQIIVEAALTAGEPVSGAGTMTLDSASFGLLDTDFLAGADAWTDISSFVLNFQIDRTSTRQAGPLLQWQASTASITIDNSDGRFDPDNLSGPYVSGGVSQIHAMVPIRVRCVWDGSDYYLFRGFANSWTESTTDYNAGYSEWAIAATDGFYILAGIALPALVSAVGAGEDTGARINRILNSAGWYTGQGAGSRVVGTGDSTLQSTTYGDYALNLLQLAADSEIGQIYIDGQGAFVFRNRRALLNDARSNTSQATFGDSPSGTSELAVATISRMDDDTTIANDVQATRVGGVLQEVQNAASVARYLFPRTYQRSDLILQDDTTTLEWANWVCYIGATGEDRFDTVAVDPAADTGNLWPQVLGREIGDRVTIRKRPPPSLSAAVTKDCFIAGISHTFDNSTGAWLTTWTMQDASKYGSFLTLDNTPLGELDANALTF